MTDKTELTSAFTDGEVKDAEVDRLLSGLYGDEALRKRWQRYHLIGDALRKNLPPTIHTDLSQQISQKLQAEPTILSPDFSTRTTTIDQAAPKRKVGYAVAASIAMVGMVSFFMLGSQVKQSPTEVASLATNNAPAIASTTTSSSLPTTPHVVLTSNTEKPLVVDRLERSNSKLQSYILDHEYSSSSVVRRGLPSGVRVVTFSNNANER